MRKDVRVPEKRISKIKENKDRLQKKAGVEINIDGLEVKMKGKSLKVWKAKDIINAIGNGFSIQKSLKLLSEKNQLKIVKLKHVTSSRESIDKIKGRIIGRDGRTRELIEEYSKALVSVYGDDVSIIGGPEEIQVAMRAVKMLINGSPHAKVYHYLEQHQPTTTKNEVNYAEKDSKGNGP